MNLYLSTWRSLWARVDNLGWKAEKTGFEVKDLLDEVSKVSKASVKVKGLQKKGVFTNSCSPSLVLEANLL